MMKKSKVAALVLLAALVSAPSAHAQIVWDWSFGANSGTFTTNGTAPGNVAAPGTYNFTDFSVTSSGDGALLGSVSGGQWSPAGFSSTTPYDMVWSGSSVTQWIPAGSNSFSWWVFQETSAQNYMLFGWRSGNINDATQAAYFVGNVNVPSYDVSVSVHQSVVATPEPATFGLLAIGLVGIGAVRRRTRRTL